ncbi:MAG: menaquinone-dependent protoporphyrinogen IX dehydrogenase [Betaproteobacteria bacterium]|nr:MAG: menaquinone-dependent protoporphyrinogen IX dehydrogenase [Betaproteobacteria bacterium]
MSKFLVLYSTVDGHTARICQRLQQRFERYGHAVTLADLGENPAIDLAPFDRVVVGASIRYGRHRPCVAAFMRAQRGALERRRCAFFTVNIVARKPAKNTPQTNPYMKKFLKQIGWRPPQLAVFAGRLDYPRYTFWDRQIIRFIMLLTQGPTDPATVIEYTDWQQVEAFARALGEP